MAITTSDRIEFLRNQLTYEYCKEGQVTKKALYLSEMLDRLIVEYHQMQNPNTPVEYRLTAK
jgi:hypothetical protein